jgi:glycosyltransferase involved in cell wall biosynthesis
MPAPTVTLLLVARGGAPGLRATLASADAAIREAQAQNISCKLLQIRPKGGDWGTERNRALKLVRSPLVGFLEAGDLISANWITSCVELLRDQKARRWILHPEQNLVFGERFLHFESPDQLSASFNPAGLVWSNYWSPLVFGRTQELRKLPWPRRRPGFGREGWTWNCDAIVSRFTHRAVSGTAHFLRDGSAHARDLCDPDWRTPVYPSRFFAQAGPAPETKSDAPWSEAHASAWRAAAELESRLEPKDGNFWPAERMAFSSGKLTPLFKSFLQELGPAPDYVFAIHQLRRGGSELEAIAHARALRHANPRARIQFVTTECSDSDWIDLLPEGSRVLAFGRETVQYVSRDDQIRLLLKLLLQSRPRAIHCKHSSQCWEAFKECGQALRHASRLYGSLYCVDRSPDGKPFSYAYTHLRHCSRRLDAVFFDNQAMADHIRESCGIRNSRVLHFPVLAQAGAARTPRASGRSLRLLWASRLCKQKNLDALFSLARQLPQDEIHVFGEFSEELPPSWRESLTLIPNLFYFGSFDGLDSLNADEYDALLYTSLWDGLPNILLEAGVKGLPILAPSVGGIPELIDRQTGFIAKREDQYLEHLETLRQRPREGERRAANLKKRIEQRHSFKAFYSELKGVPGYLT